ncbi:MAG: DUF29 domain-containing protein [Oscillatoriaceae cyanobacterium]
MAENPEVKLYDLDFAQWVAATVAQLQAREFDRLDLPNLIEEIETLGKRDKRELQSRLQVLISHLLKRCYIASANDFRGWELTIREQRRELQLLLAQSPSLKSYFLDIFAKCWQDALEEVSSDYPGFDLPHICPFPTDTDAILSQRFWED